ncbi:MAG: PAS domain-containing sensor histidine kinase [Candidatus Marinimicrobia bacterium]|nr:PAS domain-containing sensor histidine kinase [Candidatus Neomarinimicrobiota bacterium]
MDKKDRLLGNEDWFKQLIKNSFDMIVLLDANGTQRYVSESCEKILGYKPEELTGIPVIETMLHPDDQESTKKDFIDILEKKAHGGAQYRHRHKNGGWVYLEAFGNNQLDNPVINAVVLNVRDITERKNAEQMIKENEVRLKALNDTKDRFFSIIGHDLKNPFSSVVGFSNLIVDHIQKEDYKSVAEFATIIQSSANRAMSLLSNLLEWSQAQTGKIEFNPEYIELVSVINDVMALFDDSAGQKSITLSKNLPHSLPVLADKAMINSILRNLISNGIKFTRPGGVIIIIAEQAENELVVSVADNGVGIKPAAVDKLFRIDTAYTTAGTNRETGTGLGLLLCKEFIDLHGGRIWIESELDKGSTFSFSIPIL